MAISKEELFACIKHDKKLDEKLFNFPCHTQAVERCIKLVTKASLKVGGRDSRDGFVRATMESRRKRHNLSQRKTWFHVIYCFNGTVLNPAIKQLL